MDQMNQPDPARPERGLSVPGRIGISVCRENEQDDIGAEGGIRTPTPFRAHGPKPCASAVPPLPREASVPQRPFTLARRRPPAVVRPFVPERNRLGVNDL